MPTCWWCCKKAALSSRERTSNFPHVRVYTNSFTKCKRTAIDTGQPDKIQSLSIEGSRLIYASKSQNNRVARHDHANPGCWGDLEHRALYGRFQATWIRRVLRRSACPYTHDANGAGG